MPDSPALAGYGATPQVISWGPSSNHPGGVVNHLAADGAIHAITDDIDPTLYMHLVTRAGREPIAEQAFPAVAVEAPAAAENPANVAQSGREAALTFERDPTRLLTASSVPIWVLAFSGDDKVLAASGGGGRDSAAPGLVRVWDFGKREEIAAYPTPRGDLNVTLSPDGRRVAWTSWTGDCWMYEVGGSQVMHTKFGLPSRTAFSPDGSLLVAGAEGTRLELWDAVAGKELGGFLGDTLPFFWLGFSPDGNYMVGAGGRPNFGGDVQAAVWDVASRKQLYTLSDNPTANLVCRDFARQQNLGHQRRKFDRAAGFGHRKSSATAPRRRRARSSASPFRPPARSSPRPAAIVMMAW